MQMNALAATPNWTSLPENATAFERMGALCMQVARDCARLAGQDEGLCLHDLVGNAVQEVLGMVSIARDSGMAEITDLTVEVGRHLRDARDTLVAICDIPRFDLNLLLLARDLQELDALYGASFGTH